MLLRVLGSELNAGVSGSMRTFRGETAEADPCRLWWKVTSPDNSLPYTAFLLFASHKAGIVLKGNNFYLLLCSSKRKTANPGKLWFEFCKFLLYKKHWRMPCLLKIVDAWVFGGLEGQGALYSRSARSVMSFILEELNQPQIECTKSASIHRHGTRSCTVMWVA